MLPPLEHKTPRGIKKNDIIIIFVYREHFTMLSIYRDRVKNRVARGFQLEKKKDEAKIMLSHTNLKEKHAQGSVHIFP